MASASGEMKGKRRHAASAKTRRASRKAPRAKNKPLNVARDATLNRELQDGDRFTRGRRGALSNGFEVLALISRRSRAALELPTRLARCHSPFEFWSMQAQFVKEGFTDCQSVALRMMTDPLHALSMAGSKPLDMVRS